MVGHLGQATIMTSIVRGASCSSIIFGTRLGADPLEISSRGFHCTSMGRTLVGRDGAIQTTDRWARRQLPSNLQLRLQTALSKKLNCRSDHPLLQFFFFFLAMEPNGSNRAHEQPNPHRGIWHEARDLILSCGSSPRVGFVAHKKIAPR